MEPEQSSSPTGVAGAAGPRAGGPLAGSPVGPIRIERERLPDGRAITYYSRPAGVDEPATGRPA